MDTVPASKAHSDDIVALAELLRPTLLRASRRLRNEALKAGTSAMDAALLGQIEKQPGVGVCELADAERMARPTMSGHVKRLQAAGWVSRREDLSDGRRSGLEITEEGRRQLDAVRELRNDWLATRLEALSPDSLEALQAAVGPLGDLARL